MFDIYKVFAKGGEIKGYEGKIYLGEIVTAENSRPFDVALETYDKLSKEDIELEYVRKLSSNEESLDKYNDDYYLKIEYYDMNEVSYYEFESSVISYALFHNRYNFMNNVDFTDSEYSGWQEMKENIEKEYEPVCILPVSLYYHSGLSLSIGESSGWDSGQIGFIYISKENFKKMKIKEEECEKFLEKQIEVYDDVINNRTYGVYIYDLKNRPGVEIGPIESIFSFVGDDFKTNGLYEEVNSAIPEELDLDSIKAVKY